MTERIRIIAALTTVSFICGLILAAVHKTTEDAIAAAERNDFLAGLADVLPPYDNFPDKDVVDINGTEVYKAKTGDAPSGYAAAFSSGKGYGGPVYVLVGIDIQGRVSGVSVLKHRETPGLGDKISGRDFLDSFKGLSEPDKIFVKKDGGIIDSFSGATMSPRAVADAVKNALEFLRDNFVSEDDK